MDSLENKNSLEKSLDKCDNTPNSFTVELRRIKQQTGSFTVAALNIEEAKKHAKALVKEYVNRGLVAWSDDSMTEVCIECIYME